MKDMGRDLKAWDRKDRILKITTIVTGIAAIICIVLFFVVISLVARARGWDEFVPFINFASPPPISY